MPNTPTNRPEVRHGEGPCHSIRRVPGGWRTRDPMGETLWIHHPPELSAAGIYVRGCGSRRCKCPLEIVSDFPDFRRRR